MNNEKNISAPAAEPKPESFAPPIRNTSAAPEKPAPKKYVGPEYKYGIVIPGTTIQVKPKEMTPAEIAELIAMYPPAADWWK